MTTELAKRPAQTIVQSDAANMKIAEIFAKSGMFPGIKDMAQAFVKIQAGAELGISPFAAMRGVHVIQGQTALGVHLMSAKVKSSGRYTYRIIEQTDKACRIDWYEAGERIGESAFTVEDAQRAGLLTKDNYKKYPSDMLYARALSRGARRYCPDALGGAVYLPEELGVDTDQHGNAVAPAAQSKTDRFNAELGVAEPSLDEQVMDVDVEPPDAVAEVLEAFPGSEVVDDGHARFSTLCREYFDQHEWDRESRKRAADAMKESGKVKDLRNLLPAQRASILSDLGAGNFNHCKEGN